MATNRRTTARDDVEPDVPRRRWGRASLWIGSILVLVAVAVVASFAGEKDTDVLAEPPVDTDTFCLTAARFASFDHLDISEGGSEQLRALAVVATQLGTLSPQKITDDFGAVSNALRNVAAAVDTVPADDPNGLAVVTQKLDDELAAVSSQANEAADYIEQWCGPLDSLGTSLPGPDVTAVPDPTVQPDAEQTTEPPG